MKSKPGESLLELLESIARKTGRIAGDHFASLSSLKVEIKRDGTPVSKADSEAEAFAREMILSLFPQDGILGEELGEVNSGARRRWFIDPIDGTKSFLRGVPLWGTLIGVVDGEEVVAGAMYFPALDEMVLAEVGKGCFWNGKKASVSEVSTLGEATLLTTEIKNLPSHLAHLFSKGKVTRTWGDCYGYLLVATGRAEAMLDPILSPWDAVALKPIIEEAGGVFSDLKARPTAFGGNALATNMALSQAIRAHLVTEKVHPPSASFSLDAIDFAKGSGLVPVVTQDAHTGAVLMVAYASREALELTLRTGEMHYHSRKRGLWHKGATSGHIQRVCSLSLDCDNDTVLAQVESLGPACHTGTMSCFRDVNVVDSLGELDLRIASRRLPSSENDASYTRKLFENRNLRLKKLGEEMAELIVALCDSDQEHIAEEASDLMYHTLVALHAENVTLADIKRVLRSRQK